MIEIKPAGVESIETIRHLAYETWPVAYGNILSSEQLKYMLEKFYSLSSLQHQISDLHHQFLLVSKNEKAIGFASFSPHDENATIFHLNKIYVLPGQQGQSIGKQLLDFVINEIRKCGGVAVQLNVNRNNKALHFYERQGFTIIREEDIDIGNGYFMNDYVMEVLVES